MDLICPAYFPSTNKYTYFLRVFQRYFLLALLSGLSLKTEFKALNFPLAFSILSPCYLFKSDLTFPKIL